MVEYKISSKRSGLSDTSSAAEAAEQQRKRHVTNAKDEEEDLLEQHKTLQEAIFSCMYTLARSRTSDSWQWATAKVVLEGLVPFLVLFKPHHWPPIDTSNPLWQVVRWAQPVAPVVAIWSYGVYIRVFYVLVGLIFGVVAAISALTLAMRKSDQSKWLRRSAILLQAFTDVLYGMAYVAVFDFILFIFDCRFTSEGRPHNYWKDVHCLSQPHLTHLVVASVTGVVFFLSTALMQVAGCDLSPIASGLLASPAAVTRLQVLCLKALYVVAADILVATGKVQAVAMALCAAGIVWLNFKELPYLNKHVNSLWVGSWSAVSYVCIVHMVMDLRNAERDPMYVRIVLYGIFPALLAGGAATAAWAAYCMRPASMFRGLSVVSARALKLHTKMGSPDEVLLLSRAMRVFNDDGVVEEEAAALGETIIKCSLVAYPSNVALFILYANFLMEVKREGPAARTQLQLALKAGPSLVQRYQIFAAMQASKRLREGQEGQLDLQSYVEFKRNFRAVIRLHKAALGAQRSFWQVLQRAGSLRLSGVETALRETETAAGAAEAVYRRVLERYPRNGKLLRCYGKFLEEVRHEPERAARVYADATRYGGGNGAGAGLLDLDLQAGGASRHEFLTSADLREDAVVVINADGVILMVNSCVTELLGYSRAELEGSNVSMVMPQPFSSRHSGYLARYAQGGEAHILDTVRDVVALHKTRHVFPSKLCVTRLSGVGSDAVFLGVLRPAPVDARCLRAWLSPSGTILCSDTHFASLTGLLADEMVGRNFRTLVTDMAAVDDLLERCRTVPYEVLVAGGVEGRLELAHRYLPPVPVVVQVTPGGTDSQRIFVLAARREASPVGNPQQRRMSSSSGAIIGAPADAGPCSPPGPGGGVSDSAEGGLLIVDGRGAIVFATWDVAALLGYPLRTFLSMRLGQVLPEPFATMHIVKHLKDAPPVIPPVSCRAGRLVHMLSANGSHVPVRLRISSRDEDVATTGAICTKHVIQVTKVDATDPAALHADRRLSLLTTLDGRILSADPPTTDLFGFTASRLVGSNLADCIDVFTDFRSRIGPHQLQLLLLSLLDKEAELPGTSWRVKVHPPPETPAPTDGRYYRRTATSGLVVPLPSIRGDGGSRMAAPVLRRPGGRSACLQTELVESDELVSGVGQKCMGGQQTDADGDGEGGAISGGKGEGGGQGLVEGVGGHINLARITLWRRDLLTGVVEMDEHLVIRRADVSTGLIVGLPPSALSGQPLHRLLDINRGMTWQELMTSKHPHSALKSGASGVVSEPRAFLGPHPDGGTMRLILQGVTGGPGGRITATLHPDTAYVGARANLIPALGLAGLLGVGGGPDSTHPYPHGGAPRALGPRQQSVLLPARQLGLPRGPTLARSVAVESVRGSRIHRTSDRRRRSTGGAGGGFQKQGYSERHHLSGIKDLGLQTGLAGPTTDSVPVRLAVGSVANPPTTAVTDTGPSRAADGADSEGEQNPESSTVSLEDERHGRGGNNGDDGYKQGAAGSANSRRSASSVVSGGDSDDHADRAETVPVVENGLEVADAEKALAEEGGELYKHTTTQPQFVRKWVHTLSRNMRAAASLPRSGASSRVPSRKANLTAAPTIIIGAHGATCTIPNKATCTTDAAIAAAGALGPVDATTEVLLKSAAALSNEMPAGNGHGYGDGDVDVGEDPLKALDVVPRRPQTGPAGGRRRNRRDAQLLHTAGQGVGGQTVGIEFNDGSDESEGQQAGGGRVAAAGRGRGDGGESELGAESIVADTEDEDYDGGPGGGRGALSDVTSVTEVELGCDVRRIRLLKSLKKVLAGPAQAAPLLRLRLHTLLLLLGMLAVHVVAYVVLVSLVDAQYGRVHGLRRVALAADRCQIAALKAHVVEFCSRPGIAAMSCCEPPVESTLTDLRAALDDLESYHQGAYLGASKNPAPLSDAELWSLWTAPVLTYQALLDVDPPRLTNLTAGVWQLGNRFIAAGRELLYWGAKLEGRIGDLRTTAFLLANGPESLFRGYANSLDLAAAAAWRHVRTLQQSLLAILLVEAVVIQLFCILYEWWLVRRVEQTRRGSVAVGVGLPAPILRIMANKPLVVLEDSSVDDETEDGDAGAPVGANEGPSHDADVADTRSWWGGSQEAGEVKNGTVRSSVAPQSSRGCASIDTAMAPYHVSTGATGNYAVAKASAEYQQQAGRRHQTSAGGSPSPPPPPPLLPRAQRQSQDGGVVERKRPRRASINFASPGVGYAGDAAADDGRAGAAAALESGGDKGSGGNGIHQQTPSPVWPRSAAPLVMVAVEQLQESPATAPLDFYKNIKGSGGGGVRGSLKPSAEALAYMCEIGSMDGGGGSVRTSDSGVVGRRGPIVGADRRSGRLHVNGKNLETSRKHVLTFMLPLGAWEVGLLAVVALSYVWLTNMENPLASLNMASRVIYRYTRVRMSSLMLVAGRTVDERAIWRAVLTTELGNLKSEYDTLMYGGLAITQADSAYRHPVPASTFESSSFAGNFFREQRCFRWDLSTCYKPGSPYYEVTHHGLDVMVRRVMSEMALLVADDDNEVSYNNSRYITLYAVGSKDTYEGLQSSAQLFVDYMIGRYQQVKLLHTLLLVGTITIFTGYILFVLRPYDAAVKRESLVLAGLLSAVPAECDVVSHARQVLRAYAQLLARGVGGGGKGGRGGAGWYGKRAASIVMTKNNSDR